MCTSRTTAVLASGKIVYSISKNVPCFRQSQDGAKIRDNGFFHGWTPKTLIPIATNAAGGIVVGIVTKYAGSVKKGFALIFGLLLSGVLQAFMEEDNGNKQGSKITKEHIAGGILAAFSLWMHSAFPVIPSVKIT